VRFSFLGVVGFSSLALFLDIGDVFAGSSYIRFFFFDPRFLYPRRGLFGLVMQLNLERYMLLVEFLWFFSQKVVITFIICVALPITP